MGLSWPRWQALAAAVRAATRDGQPLALLGCFGVVPGRPIPVQKRRDVKGNTLRQSKMTRATFELLQVQRKETKVDALPSVIISFDFLVHLFQGPKAVPQNFDRKKRWSG